MEDKVIYNKILSYIGDENVPLNQKKELMELWKIYKNLENKDVIKYEKKLFSEIPENKKIDFEISRIYNKSDEFDNELKNIKSLQKYFDIDAFTLTEAKMKIVDIELRLGMPIYLLSGIRPLLEEKIKKREEPKIKK